MNGRCRSCSAPLLTVRGVGEAGGGISNGLGGGGETLTVINSTFTGNSAVYGGGIFTESGTTVLRNTIVANSPSGANCSGSIPDDGDHNLDDGTSCGFSAANGPLSNTDPQLAPAGLKDNGGPTQTIALLPARFSRLGEGYPAGAVSAVPTAGQIDAWTP